MPGRNMQRGDDGQRVMIGTRRLVALGMLLFFIVSCGAARKDVISEAPRNPEWARPIVLEGVPNLHKVDDNLYRSAQPTSDGMRNLEKLGIKTVINLREFHDDKDETDKTGLRRIDIPMLAWDVKDGSLVEALKQLKNKEQGPYLVHCMHGADRTGVVNAMYRIVYQQWDKEKALDEMRNGGYGFHEVWANIVKYINGVDVDALKRSLAD